MQSSNVWSTWRASAGRRRAQTTITRASIIEHAASTCPAVSYVPSKYTRRMRSNKKNAVADSRVRYGA